ncbi:ROK family transcriptional regulator [Nocardioides scoriae]|uniref:ROK family transcriptional regulator n=1 Tax=Nocardioides scoriae TaxID=642780 RepID=UPI001E46821D|nr:ROK family transcriptional regulator [Nocardioides scoriae]
MLGGPATAGEVFSLVRDSRAVTRSEIGRLTGLSRTAVAARVQALLDYGLVVEGVEDDQDERPPSAGRPPVRLRFNRAAGVVLAAAIGRSRTQLGVCDLDGSVLVSRDVEQEVGLTPEVLMPRVVAALEELLAEAGADAAQVRATGLSIPGTVDTSTGASLDSPIMSNWDGVPLAPFLAGLTSAPVFVDNDANVMALSERRGHLETFDELLFVKASTGIGVGVVTEGRLVRGGLGAGGEIGHTKTPAAEGLLCRCGERGCLETVAAGWSLVQGAREAGHEVSHVRDLVALATHGDAEARQQVRTAGRRIGEVVAAAVNLLNPEAVVVGGDLAAAYDPFVAGLRESLYSLATALATRDLVIVPLSHGERSGVVGCAAMALREVLDSTAVDRALALAAARAAS